MEERKLRRGLPRLVGGGSWPPSEFVTASEESSSPVEERTRQEVPTGRSGLPPVTGGDPLAELTNVADVPAQLSSTGPGQAVPSASPAEGATILPPTSSVGGAAPQGRTDVVVRRGLPSAPGQKAQPAQSPQRLTRTAAPGAGSADSPSAGSPSFAGSPSSGGTPAPPRRRSGLQARGAEVPGPALSASTAGRRTNAADAGTSDSASRRRQGGWPLAARVAVGALAAGALAAVLSFLARALLATGPLTEFIAAYPGEYSLPAGAPVGFPAWVGWQHFFNVFLMVLIIRSGLQVRSEQRPTTFWTSKRPGGPKISLALWFHQSLDILWLVNGVVFVILLFVSGQWSRIVPTSWEVFPNALSALLQYLSFDWPTENGWVNYNSLQQLAYFITVFIAAPLAAVTGVRMSGLWPKRPEGLSRAYPVEWARALHFPVMLYFIGFIAVHVVLVFATGVLRNLNHMYAAQEGSSWAGFWIFVASIVVITGAWFAARPILLVPIAKLFGKVSRR